MVTQALQLSQLVGTVVSSTAGLQANVAPQHVLADFMAPRLTQIESLGLQRIISPIQALHVRSHTEPVDRVELSRALLNCIHELRSIEPDLDQVLSQKLMWAEQQLSPLSPDYLPAGLSLVGEDPALIHYNGMIESFTNPAGIIKMDGGGLKLLLLNEANETVSGFSRMHLLTINFADNYHPDDVVKFGELIQSVVLTGKGFLNEVRLKVNESAPIKIKYGNDYYMWVDVEVGRIERTPYIYYELINVTQRVLAQQLNRDLEMMFRISGIPLSVIEVRQDGSTERVLSSSAFVKMLGYPTGGDGMREIGVLDVIDEKHHPELQQHIELFLETGQLEWLDAPMKRADGKETHIDISARASTINGKTYAIVVYEKTADRVQRTEDAVRRRLAGGIAHDLNNQLTGVMGYLGLMLRGNSLYGNSRVAIELVMEIMDEMKEAINYFRGASDAVVGGPIDPYPLFEPKRLSMLFGREAQLEVRFAAARLSVEGPRFPITQIISVLLNNAVEAMEGMPSTERQINIETRNIWLTNRQLRLGRYLPWHVKSGPYLRLSIANNGPHIPVQMLRSIFEKNRSTKKGKVGRGVGLHTVAQLVADRHGFVEAHNLPDRGVRFDVYLPVVSEGPFDFDSRGQERVLVVDDEAINRMGIEMALNDLKYADVLLAKDGQEALEIIERRGGELAAVITDRTMPRLKGDVLIQLIRETHPTLPVILQTGDAEFTLDEDEQTGFLIKPWNIDDLAGKLRLLIDEFRARNAG